VTTLVPTLAEVAWTRRDLPDVVTIGFDPTGAEGVAPGQFQMLWAIGVGEVPISVSGIGDDGSVEHTIRDVGNATSALAALTAGDQVGVRGPFGRGWDLTSLAGRDLLVVAGGLGIAPLRPVIELARAGALEADSVRILFGARDPAQLLFADQIADRWAGLDATLTVDVAESGWSGHVGTVTHLLGPALVAPERTVALVCGPELMMVVVAKELTSAGVAPDRIQVSLERNMHCATGHCGHCQLGPIFVCVDGPVVTWAAAASPVKVRAR
jgi:anaerobic sulfite reductase subunit B